MRSKGTSLRTEHTKILTWRIGDKHVIEVMNMLKKTEKVRSSSTASTARIAPAS